MLFAVGAPDPQRTRAPEMERAAIGDPGDEGASGQRRGREVVPASGNRRTSRPRARTAYATSVSIHSAIMLPPLCLAEHETELRDRTLEKRVSEQRIEDVGDRADEDELVDPPRAPLRRRDGRRHRTSSGDPGRVATGLRLACIDCAAPGQASLRRWIRLTLSRDWNGHRGQTAPR